MHLSLISVEKIWDQAPHNGFTDLIRHENVWYCAFREGSSHMSFDGQARILSSPNGQCWTSVASLVWVGGDVRDPKFSITPDGLLLVTAGVRLAVANHSLDRLFSVAWLKSSSNEFLMPQTCETSSGTWRWSPTWHENLAYSVGYAAKDRAGCLYSSLDGLNWHPLIQSFFPTDGCFANESSLVFDATGQAICLLRRDGSECNALLGRASKPYLDWSWVDLGLYIGGPKLITLSNATMIAGFRVFEEEHAKMVLAELAETNTLTRLLELPSGGDCSYPGLIDFEGVLWVSYYSSHEDKTAIYLAQIEYS